MPDVELTVFSHGSPVVGGTAIDERFFDVLGVRPLLGGFNDGDFAWFLESERTKQRVRPVLLSYRRWLNDFGGDPDVVGRTIIETDREDFVAGIREYHRDHMLLLEASVSESGTRAETQEKLKALPRLIGSVDGVDAVAMSTIQTMFARRTPPYTNVMPEGWSGAIEGITSREVSANSRGCTLRLGEASGVVGLAVRVARVRCPGRARHRHLSDCWRCRRLIEHVRSASA